MGAVIDAAALDDAIERGSLALPAVAGMTWWVPIPGVTVRDSAFDSHRANQVAGARLLPEQIDGTVAAVRAHFGARRSSWNVGVASTPSRLEPALASAGYAMTRESAGLAMIGLDRPIPAPAVTIRRAEPSDAERLAHIGATEFGQDADEARWLQRWSLASPELFVWLVCEHDDRDAPILAFGQGFHGRDGIARLSGAATLPHARGRGLYRALLQHRLQQAHRAGQAAAVIQANDETSGPICRRVGFGDRGRVRLWVR